VGVASNFISFDEERKKQKNKIFFVLFLFKNVFLFYFILFRRYPLELKLKFLLSEQEKQVT
jgi:hypothetical protein